MNIITTDAVTEALHKAVAAKGEDYVYEHVDNATAACRYTTHSGEKSCIVGWVVAELDPELFQALYEYEEEEDGVMSAGDLVDPYNGIHHTLHLEDDTIIPALAAAQSIQDGEMPWGWAQEAYDRVLAGERHDDVVNELNDRWGRLQYPENYEDEAESK